MLCRAARYALRSYYAVDNALPFVRDLPRITWREKFCAHFLLQFAGSAFILRHEFSFVGKIPSIEVKLQRR